MRIFLSLLGIVVSFLLIKYRERIGEMTGEAEWMRKIGGIHNLLILAGIFIFFWSIAELTGTTQIFLEPVRFLLPGEALHTPPTPTF